MLPFTKKTPSQNNAHDHFFALQISPEVVKSAIWAIYNDKPQVLSVGLVAHWDNQNLPSLISGADQTVSDAIARLGRTDKIGPQKVIFGLPPDWATEDKINPDRIGFVKGLSTKLALHPIGFVVSAQALVNHIHTLEGVPPTAILLGFWPHFLEITVVCLGKNEGTFLVARGSNPLEDVIEGLHRFGHLDMLPSRMLLYDSGTDLEEIRQLLLSHPWLAPNKSLPFLHFPKIESLASEFSIRSIALSGGTEVAHALGLITEPEPVSETQPVEASSTELGFAPQPLEAEEVYIPLPASPVRPLPSFRLPAFKPPLIVGLATLIVTLIVSLTAAYWYLPKAKVVITVDPKKLDHSFELLADTRATSVDEVKLVIPAIVLDASVSNNQSIPTTGSKTIGDKATATVTIFNGTDGPYKFASGTVLTSPSSLKYLTQEPITVASGSGTVANLQPGKAQVKAAASQIGPDYNISSGTSLRVANFSQRDITAQNDEAFSGGSSQKVKSVAKDDIAKLKASLTADLKATAREELLKKVSSDQTLIPESITIETKSENFDHKLDEPADNLKLDVSVTSHGLVVSKSNLTQLTTSQITPLISPGYAPDADPKQSFTVKKTDKTSATFQVAVSAVLLPKIDTATVTGNLSAKSPGLARDYLKNIPGVTQVDIVISPVLPNFLTVLPRVPGNITISIQTK